MRSHEPNKLRTAGWIFNNPLNFLNFFLLWKVNLQLSDKCKENNICKKASELSWVTLGINSTCSSCERDTVLEQTCCFTDLLWTKVSWLLQHPAVISVISLLRDFNHWRSNTQRVEPKILKQNKLCYQSAAVKTGAVGFDKSSTVREELRNFDSVCIWHLQLHDSTGVFSYVLRNSTFTSAALCFLF